LSSVFRQTRVRLALAYAAIFGFVAAVAAVAVWLALAEAQYSALDESLASESRSIALVVSRGEVAGLAQSGGSSQFGLLLFSTDGSLVASAWQPPPAATLQPIVQRAAASGSSVFTTQAIDGVSQRVDATSVTASDGNRRILVLTRSTAEADKLLGTAAIVLGAGTVVLIIAASVVGFGLAGTALRPVREITSAARTFSEHDLHRRIQMDLPSDELGELARTFNSMLDRLELAFESLRRFTADAAHELRAPLALIRTEAEVALRREHTSAEYAASLSTILEEGERLSRLAEQLLLLAQADAGALLTRRVALDLGRIVRDAAERWQRVAAGRDVVLTCEVTGQAPVRGDADLLTRLVDNLVDNALRYAPPATEVTLDCRRADKSWEVAVVDRGPGVPPELRETLFERFSRGDHARRRETGGAGLGLALCAAIARLHDGTITLDSAEPSGARFVVSLPALVDYGSISVGLDWAERSTAAVPDG